MATVNSIVLRALRLLKVKEAGEPLEFDEGKDAREVLNNIVDAWANESLLLYQWIKLEIPFVQGKKEYTLGPGGDFDTTRPIAIENASVRSGITDYIIEEINNTQYAKIAIKTIINTFPSVFYYRPAFPLGVVTVWPEPSVNLEFHMNVKMQFTQFTTMEAVVNLPPGYVRALEYNLAVELAPEYTNAISSIITEKAIESKSTIQDTNTIHTPILEPDVLEVLSRYGNRNYFSFGGSAESCECPDTGGTITESGFNGDTITESGSNTNTITEGV